MDGCGNADMQIDSPRNSYAHNKTILDVHLTVVIF